VVLTDLFVRYGPVTAVDGLSFAVERGSVHALLGPNGAGKTSTIEVCEGYRRPSAGSARVLGLDPVGDHHRLMPRIGVMLQAGGVYPGARAAEMLRLVAAYAARPLDTAMLTERLGLAKVANTPYRRLSGGEKQRLSLAMAVVGRPDLVFLDEPTAGMDPQARHATWDLVDELREDGVTVVLTTHLMDEAERLADRVTIIDSGKVLADDTPGHLTSSCEQLSFTSRAHLPLAALQAVLPAGLAALEPRPGEYVVSGDLTPQVLAAVTAWGAGQDVLLGDLRTAKRTLEDVFLELTGRGLRT
jgi:ABC-2 type transport system ATP-binding protein